MRSQLLRPPIPGGAELQNIWSRRCPGILHFTVVPKKITLQNLWLSCLVLKKRRETILAGISLITCPSTGAPQSSGIFLNPTRENCAFQPLLHSFLCPLMMLVDEGVWQCSVSGQFYEDCPYLSPINVHFQGISQSPGSSDTV